MTDPVYRLCRKCGHRWNVSCLDPGGKVYLCPFCSQKTGDGHQ